MSRVAAYQSKGDITAAGYAGSETKGFRSSEQREASGPPEGAGRNGEACPNVTEQDCGFQAEECGSVGNALKNF